MVKARRHIGGRRWLTAVGPRCSPSRRLLRAGGCAATDDRQVVPTTILNPLCSIFAFISIFAFSLQPFLPAIVPHCGTTAGAFSLHFSVRRQNVKALDDGVVVCHHGLTDKIACKKGIRSEEPS